MNKFEWSIHLKHEINFIKLNIQVSAALVKIQLILANKHAWLEEVVTKWEQGLFSEILTVNPALEYQLS